MPTVRLPRPLPTAPLNKIGKPMVTQQMVEMLRARAIAGLVIERMPSALCPGRTLPFDIALFAAVELVVSQLHRGESGPPAHAMSYLVSGTWQPGKTVRRVGPTLDLDAAFFSDLLRT